MSFNYLPASNEKHYTFKYPLFNITEFWLLLMTEIILPLMNLIKGAIYNAELKEFIFQENC